MDFKVNDKIIVEKDNKKLYISVQVNGNLDFYMYLGPKSSDASSFIIDDENPNVEDLTVPIKINNCGYYRVHTGPVIETPHPEGRNDYQLLYIAAGKGHFYFKGSTKATIVEKGNMVLFRPKEPQVYYYYAKDKTEVLGGLFVWMQEWGE